jgi:hypothetical protein
MTPGGMDGCPAVALDLRFHPLHVRPDAGALIVHVTLALSAVWQRRLLKLLTAEACKAFFGSLCRCSLRSNSRTLALLPRSAAGILVTMGAYRSRSGTVVPSRDLADSIAAGRLDALCIGLRFWMRLWPWSDTAQPSLCTTACIERPCVSTGRAASCT